MKKFLPILIFLLASDVSSGAVTETTLANSFSATDATSYVTASQSPGANRLVLAAIAAVASTLSNQPTLTGNGLTWVAIHSRQVGVGTRRLTVFRAMGAAPSAGAATIDFAGQTQTDCLWVISDFVEVDTSGTNGSGAVVQFAHNGADSGATSLTVTLAAFGSASNATYGAFATPVNQTISPGSGFSNIATHGSGGFPIALGAEWKNNNDTSVDASWTTATAVAGIALEIKAAATAAPLFKVYYDLLRVE